MKFDNQVRENNAQESDESSSRSKSTARTEIIEVSTLELPEVVASRPKRPNSKAHSFFEQYIEGMAAKMHLVNLDQVAALARDLLTARAKGNNIFLIGNGGSAAIASHLANDLGKKRFEDERYSFRVTSLTDNLSTISMIANDFGYDHIFDHQLRNLMEPGDLLIAISSSGNSRNIINAVEYANAKGALTWGLAGFDGGLLKERAKQVLLIPSKQGQYGYAEDLSMMVGHMVSIYITEHDQAEHQGIG